VKAFRSLSSFRAEAKFSTWLISITLNEARNRLRKQSAIRLESLDWPADDNSGVSPALWCLFLRRSTRNATASGQFAMSFPKEPAFHPPESPGHLRQSSVCSAFSLRPQDHTDHHSRPSAVTSSRALRHFSSQEAGHFTPPESGPGEAMYVACEDCGALPRESPQIASKSQMLTVL
jgi:Sigma-70 region 2